MNLWTSARKQLKIISTISKYQALFHSLEYYLSTFLPFFSTYDDFSSALGTCLSVCLIFVTTASKRQSYSIIWRSGCKSVRPSMCITTIHVCHYTTGTASLSLLKFSWCSPTTHNLNSSILVETRSKDYQKIQVCEYFFLIFSWLQATNWSLKTCQPKARGVI